MNGILRFDFEEECTTCLQSLEYLIKEERKQFTICTSGIQIEVRDARILKKYATFWLDFPEKDVISSGCEPDFLCLELNGHLLLEKQIPP